MKTFNEKVRKYGFGVLIFCMLYGSATFSYGQQVKPQRDNVKYSAIITLKPGMTKEEVKYILGEPYKISFSTNERQDFVENMFYKSKVYIYRDYEITYQCIFVDSKLVALQEKETLYDKVKTVLTKAIQ